MDGDTAGGLQDSPFAIDADHRAHGRRTKEPGWTEAEPQVVFLPDPIRDAIAGWAVRS